MKSSSVKVFKEEAKNLADPQPSRHVGQQQHPAWMNGGPLRDDGKLSFRDQQSMLMALQQ